MLLPIAFFLQACKEDGGAKTISEPQSKPAESVSVVKPALAGFVPPTPNLTSPDNAVKSWWALNDAIDKFTYENCRLATRGVDARIAARVNLSSGNAKEYFQKPIECDLETFDRTIERASVETDTRAVVMANIKNVTQLPEGVRLNKYSEQYVKKGVSYKYVLTRESDKWYVDEVLKYNSTNILIKEDPWQQEYKLEKYQEKYLSVSQQ